jgi:hypothetical protein
MDSLQEDKNTIVELANFIYKNENLPNLTGRFGRVGKGGAMVVFRNTKCYSINIDINRINIGAAYVLAHEISHYILISKSGNYKHDKEFKALCKRLEYKYANCAIARKLVF